MNTTSCTCNNFGCGKRIALGLAPFCALTATTEAPRANVFGSYIAAADYARIHGGRVRAGGGYLNGGPRLFSVKGGR